MKKIHVDVRVKPLSYEVRIGTGILTELASDLRERPLGKRYAVITDSQVGQLHGDTLMEALEHAGLKAQLFVFPAGESREEFIRRSVAGYENMVYHMKMIWERSAASGQWNRKIQSVSAVVHGGTIMALLSYFLGGEYFDYQAKCGQGYCGRLVFKAGGGAPQWKEFRPLSEVTVSEATV